MATRRGARAGVEDRWHRPARKDEQVSYPADAGDGDAVWCVDTKHGTPGTQVCSGRHGRGHRWQARWVGEGQERSKSFTKKVDAERHLRGVVADLETGTYADPQRSAVTFSTVAESWLRTKQAANRAPKTIAGYRGLLDAVILPKWGDERLRDITHQRLQEWITFLATDPAARAHAKRDKDGKAIQTGLSPARVIQIHQVVSQVLGFALRAKHVATNAADHIELPSKPQNKGLALTHDQVHRLAQAMVNAEKAVRYRSDTTPALTSPEALGTMVRFLASSGLRYGECIALRVGDIDTKKRRVLVSKSVTHVRGQGLVEGDTKTHQARSVPILITSLAEELSKLVAGRDPDEYLFPGPNGSAMPIGWFNARFIKAVEVLGVPGVTPHTLRHSAGSLALQSGASVATVQKLLGHRNATTTLNVYSHMLPDDFDNLAAAMDAAAIKASRAGQSG
ncbi:site-specific integrase [Mycobacterium sp. ITM-2016-00316]|uniref:tyrosine-type recombinase/integrase n=1 Tax=Mycobacterium sp. ITM-2016-00316 TaxID=2099695 RepID=UPI000CFA54E7|nr:site-specific integrase [Mycobacterium sp. ITM-2016-00316]WNG79954.1 site-specific integrase [Mycobacterium sp. ITM-2016-00316]